MNESLFDAQALEAPAALASALAPPAAPGHFDELRGAATPQTPRARHCRRSPRRCTTPPRAAAAPAAERRRSSREHAPLAPAWTGFFEHLGAGGFDDLPRRAISLERQIRDNGVTYNVYADADGPQRPWSLDLLPADRLARQAGRRSRPACSSACACSTA